MKGKFFSFSFLVAKCTEKLHGDQGRSVFQFPRVGGRNKRGPNGTARNDGCKTTGANTYIYI